MFTTFVTILYVIACAVLILVVLLQAGRGGGMGTALGGGASQGVFGGGGGADFLARLTQGLAASFMVGAVYLAYASAHTGSDRLQAESEELESEKNLVDDDQDVNYERVGPNPLPLPERGATPTPPPLEQADDAAPPEPADEPPAEPVDGPVDGPPADSAPADPAP